jgi:hypothetical protein
VVLSQGNLCSQQAAFAMLWPEIGPGDRLAAYLPWHHSFGALAERLWSLSRGACLTVVPGGGRNRELSSRRCDREAHGVHERAQDPCPGDGGGAVRRGGLRWAFTAGAPLEPTVSAWYRSSASRS